MSPRRRRADPPEGPQRRREDELEDLLEHGSRNFRRYRRRAYVAFAILALASAGAFYWVWDNARQIQQQRAESIRRSCDEQNDRHDESIKTLDALIARLPPQRRDRARANRTNTVLLIEALAPYRNCDELVRRSTSTP